MTTPKQTTLSRRTALAGLSAGGLGLAEAASTRPAEARVATDMATHPLVGTWLTGTSPNDLSLTHWDADGSQTLQSGTVPTAGDGTFTYADQSMGVWEPIDEREIHITFLWATRDANGAPINYFTVDGYPVASEDGMSFVDDGTKVVVTVRDATGATTDVINGVTRVIGVRVTPGNPGYEELLALLAASPVATPTS